MAINKIVLNTDIGEQVLVDLTDSTVTSDTLAKGVTAYDKSGAKITGTMEPGTGTEDLNEVLTEQEALIAQLQDTLKGKAAGGGASVEAFTGVVNAVEFVYAVVNYTDETMTLRTLTIDTVWEGMTVPITVAANTIITCNHEPSVKNVQEVANGYVPLGNNFELGW